MLVTDAHKMLRNNRSHKIQPPNLAAQLEQRMSGKLKLKLVQQSGKVNIGTIFWFHGSGDSGDGFYEWVKFFMGEFSFPHLKCVFPTAPLRHYTPNKGSPSRVWFNREDVRPDVPEDVETLNEIGADIKAMLQNELGIGIPYNKIIVGGFSMGGTLALHTAYRIVPGLAGVFTMCSFLNNNSLVYETLKERPENALQCPLIMFHGGSDKIVDLEWGKNTFKHLTDFGVKGEFQVLPQTFHEMKKDQLIQLFKWINKIIPPPKE